jgi:hypothetical protein
MPFKINNSPQFKWCINIKNPCFLTKKRKITEDVFIYSTNLY